MALLLAVAGCDTGSDPGGPAASAPSGSSGSSGSSATGSVAPTPADTISPLPETVTPADLSTGGVDPCSLLVADVQRTAGMVGADATDGADGPACTFSGTNGASWVLSFAPAQSLADIVDLYGGYNTEVLGVSGRAVKTETSCRIAIALTSTGTMELLYDSPAPLVGCNDTVSLMGYALAQLREVQ